LLCDTLRTFEDYDPSANLQRLLEVGCLDGFVQVATSHRLSKAAVLILLRYVFRRRGATAALLSLGSRSPGALLDLVGNGAAHVGTMTSAALTSLLLTACPSSAALELLDPLIPQLDTDQLIETCRRLHDLTLRPTAASPDLAQVYLSSCFLVAVAQPTALPEPVDDAVRRLAPLTQRWLTLARARHAGCVAAEATLLEMAGDLKASLQARLSSHRPPSGVEPERALFQVCLSHMQRVKDQLRVSERVEGELEWTVRRLIREWSALQLDEAALQRLMGQHLDSFSRPLAAVVGWSPSSLDDEGADAMQGDVQWECSPELLLEMTRHTLNRGGQEGDTTRQLVVESLRRVGRRCEPLRPIGPQKANPT